MDSSTKYLLLQAGAGLVMVVFMLLGNTDKFLWKMWPVYGAWAMFFLSMLFMVLVTLSL